MLLFQFGYYEDANCENARAYCMGGCSTRTIGDKRTSQSIDCQAEIGLPFITTAFAQEMEVALNTLVRLFRL